MKYLRRVLAAVIVGGFCLGILGHSGAITIDPKLTGRTTVTESSAYYSSSEGEDPTMLLAGDNGNLIGWIIAGILALFTAIFAGCSDSPQNV